MAANPASTAIPASTPVAVPPTVLPAPAAVTNASASATTVPATPASAPVKSAGPATPANPAVAAEKPAPVTPAPGLTLVSAGNTVIFPKEQAKALVRSVCFVVPKEITDYWTPTAADLVGVDSGLEKYLTAQNRKARGDWPKYYCQVVGVLEGPAKFLLLSFFTQEYTPEEKAAHAKDPKFNPHRWKTEPYWVNDEGDIFFRVLYDLQKKQFVWYEANNDA